MPTVKEVIVHCQNKIKKNPGSEKLLHYLKRLGRLRITIDDLRETGVGKTVNQLSRLEGEVGQYAGTIVEEWKAMVETETDENERSESESESEIENELEIDINHRTSPEQEIQDHHNNDNSSPMEQDDDDGGSELNVDTFNIIKHVKEENAEGEVKDLTGKPHLVSNENEDKDAFDHSSVIINNNNLSNTFKESNSVDYHKQRDKQREKEKHHQQQQNDINHSPISNPLDEKKSSSNISHHHRDRDNNRNSKKSKSHRKEKEDEKHKSKKSASENTINKIENIVEHKEKDCEKQSTSHTKGSEYKQYKSDNNNKDRNYHQNEKEKGDKELSSKDSNYRIRRQDRDKDDSKKTSKSTLKDEEHNSSSKRKRDTDPRKEEKLERDEDEKLNTKLNASSSSSSSSSSFFSSKHDKQREKHKSTEKDKSTSKYVGSSINDSVKIKEENPENNKDSTTKRKKADHSPEEDINKGEKSAKKQKVMSKLENQEIDSTSGLNFADVLGCLDSKTTLKTTKKQVSSSTSVGGSGNKSKKNGGESSSSSASSLLPPTKSKVSVIKTEHKNMNSTTSSNSSSSCSSNGILNESYAPPVLSIQPPKPSSLAFQPPKSSLAFQPLDLFPEEKASNRTKWEDSLLSIQENVSDYDTLSSMITSRKDRTKVYSGKNSGYVGEIPSLFNMCIRVIQENLDSLGYTGGVPFDILKPALERASVKQLGQIEFYNPYLLESTDELWKHHCHRECRGQLPQEMESWRDLYYRFQDERQQRLQKLSTKVKKNVELAQPVRKTKLAYVEPSARGPKFSKSKAATIKNGMKTLKHREEKGTKSGGSSSSGSTNHSYKEEEAAIVIASDSRAGSAPAPSIARDYNQSSGLKKPRKAPLMAKALKTMKSVFRR